MIEPLASEPFLTEPLLPARSIQPLLQAEISAAKEVLDLHQTIEHLKARLDSATANSTTRANPEATTTTSDPSQLSTQPASAGVTPTGGGSAEAAPDAPGEHQLASRQLHEDQREARILLLESGLLELQTALRQTEAEKRRQAEAHQRELEAAEADKAARVAILDHELATRSRELSALLEERDTYLHRLISQEAKQGATREDSHQGAGAASGGVEWASWDDDPLLEAVPFTERGAEHAGEGGESGSEAVRQRQRLSDDALRALIRRSGS